jgi:CheY-like chemotaxis protein
LVARIEKLLMKKALVVEDNPDSLEILTIQMELMGFSVVEANNGLEAVEKAIKEKPNLILMDIIMPVMDGREAARRIRSNSETKDIFILAATVLFLKSDLSSCIQAGCNDFITKPFTIQEFREKIQNIFPSA